MFGELGRQTIDKAIETGFDHLYPSVAWHKPNLFLRGIVDLVCPHGFKVFPSLAIATDGDHDFARAHPEYWEKRHDGRVMNSGYDTALSWVYPISENANS